MPSYCKSVKTALFSLYASIFGVLFAISLVLYLGPWDDLRRAGGIAATATLAGFIVSTGLVTIQLKGPPS